MRLVIAGGTGFLGSPLAESYAEDGHDVRVLTRGLMPGDSRHDPGTGVPGVTRVGWNPDGTAGPWVRAVDGADAVVNLAGESIADGRWTPRRKAALKDSRILPTRSLVAAIRSVPSPPRVLVSGSGVGYYGASDDRPLTEDAPAGTDLLARICVEWEAEAAKAASPSTRVVPLRTGVVLERSGGALPQMMMPFRFFAGGPVGSGRQYLSWIHRLDWIEIVRWLIETPDISGPLNATAPVPVTNREFARALGHAMHRPGFIPTPGFAVAVALGGERARSLVLTGQRAIPGRAKAAQFHFRYPEIDLAFRGIFGE
jgi:uncharacterized protein (TIGR01777 family)